jgi:MerR family transcriptional regulator, light-induced transcriptional regulator
MADNTPLYNLKAVINEVGLSPATLRAWERRYGLIKPHRSPGGHRQYSRRDIDMLKWLIERQKEGLSISSAVEMWKNQHESNVDGSLPIQTPMPEIGMGETILDGFREQWLAACLAFNDQAANRTLDQAFAVAAPEMIIAEVLQKGLALLGERWYAGSVSVQQEHFASAIAIRRVNALLAATASPTRPGHILAACPPGEEHDFVLLMTVYLLRRGGWDMVYLGSNVPLLDLDDTIQSTSPILILSSAQTLKTAASLRLMSEYIQSQGVPLAYGGGIFTHVPDATRYITGYYLGSKVGGVPHRIEQLVTIQPPMPIAQPVSAQCKQTLNSLTQNEAAIVAHVSSVFRPELIKPTHLAAAITHLNQFISSALILGDINLMDESIAWLNGLLKSYGLSVNWIGHYYTTYRRAIKLHLGEVGQPILEKLAKY